MRREYDKQALREKLMEEAHEVAIANCEDLVKELADLYEVIDAVLVEYGISRDLVLVEQERQHSERGGFDKRLKLLWTG